MRVVVNNNLLCLPNVMRGDCNVEGAQDHVCGCGGDLFPPPSNINAAAISTANLFVLEIAFDRCDALHIVSREYQLNIIAWSLT